MIFETHAHYDDKMFDEDRESLLQVLLFRKNIRLFMRQQVCIQVMPPS